MHSPGLGCHGLDGAINAPLAALHKPPTPTSLTKATRANDTDSCLICVGALARVNDSGISADSGCPLALASKSVAAKRDTNDYVQTKSSEVALSHLILF